MYNNENFKEAERWVAHEGYKKFGQIRLIGKDSVMWLDLDRDEVIKLRDNLNQLLGEAES